MRLQSYAFGAFALMQLATGAEAQSVQGNYQGGIMPWSPGVPPAAYLQAAVNHCAFYSRVPRFTSVNPSYGEYLGFACVFDRRYDPVKAGVLRWPF